MTRRAHSAIAAALVLCAASTALAAGTSPSPANEILPVRPTYQASGVDVTERLGARVPATATFRTHAGKAVTLGDVITGPVPTILTFNYSDCPMLCSLQLNGLFAALPALDTEQGFRAGSQFRIVTISLDPTESVERAAAMRDKYLAKLPEARRGAVAAGWTILVARAPGDSSQVRAVADSVGFAYKYLEDRAEYAHPAALILLSAGAAVTRYVYGIEFAPAMLSESLTKAGLAEPSSAVGFMNRCYHFDPDANNHARAGVLALRIGAVGFLVLFVGGFGALYLRRISRQDSGPAGAFVPPPAKPAGPPSRREANVP